MNDGLCSCCCVVLDNISGRIFSTATMALLTTLSQFGNHLETILRFSTNERFYTVLNPQLFFLVHKLKPTWSQRLPGSRIVWYQFHFVSSDWILSSRKKFKFVKTGRVTSRRFYIQLIVVRLIWLIERVEEAVERKLHRRMQAWKATWNINWRNVSHCSLEREK